VQGTKHCQQELEVKNQTNSYIIHENFFPLIIEIQNKNKQTRK